MVSVLVCKSERRYDKACIRAVSALWRELCKSPDKGWRKNAYLQYVEYIVAPSFDKEGRKRYLDWLEKRYNGSITKLNEAYELQVKSFDALKPEEYWFSCRYPDRESFSEEDVKAQTPCFRVMADNKRWQSEELELYFADMKKRLKEVNPEFLLCPDLTQWGYFLNVDGAMLSGVGMADLWDTAVRGIDLYRLAPFVDAAHFISVPVTPAGDPDCYVTACHHNMMRNMNRNRDFIGGIYWVDFCTMIFMHG